MSSSSYALGRPIGAEEINIGIPTTKTDNYNCGDDVCWAADFDPSDKQDIQLGVNIGIVNSHTVIIGINQRTGKQVYYRSFCPGSMARYHEVIDAILIACRKFPRSVCVVDVTPHNGVADVLRARHGVTICPVFWNKNDQSVSLRMLEINKPSFDLFDMAKSGADANSINNALICATKHILTPDFTKKTVEQRVSDIVDMLKTPAKAEVEVIPGNLPLPLLLNDVSLLPEDLKYGNKSVWIDPTTCSYIHALQRAVGSWKTQAKEARDRVGNLSGQLREAESVNGDLNKKLEHAGSDIDQLKDSFQEATKKIDRLTYYRDCEFKKSEDTIYALVFDRNIDAATKNKLGPTLTSSEMKKLEARIDLASRLQSRDLPLPGNVGPQSPARLENEFLLPEHRYQDGDKTVDYNHDFCVYIHALQCSVRFWKTLAEKETIRADNRTPEDSESAGFLNDIPSGMLLQRMAFVGGSIWVCQEEGLPRLWHNTPQLAVRSAVEQKNMAASVGQCSPGFSAGQKP
jgi:hypothetical protein